MKTSTLIVGTASLVLAPTLGAAAPVTNGQGANHATSPAATGQPSQDCVDLVASGEGSFPGHSSTAPGSAFNEDPGGVAGKHYAGEQSQNTINSATSSQYDVACLHGTRAPQ
jgi:hypothetical protein